MVENDTIDVLCDSRPTTVCYSGSTLSGRGYAFRWCSTFVLHFNFALGSNMSTTTIRLPEDLKARVAAAAKRAGTTAHSFILEAIAEKADQAERRADFHDVAEKRYADLLASGKTIPWKKMRGYLEDRIAGKTVVRLRAKKLAR
jgi:predicted DNA-binding protein